jgi:hypothetical protein
MTSLLGALKFAIYESTWFISPPAVAVEWALVALCAILVTTAPRRTASLLIPVRSALRRIARSTRLAILVCGLLPIAIRLALLGVLPVPQPSIHDEFSHLLLADTLAHGRLTNATHPMWKNLETIHVIQQPTYNSMYPSAQGGILALGQVVFHEPWTGVLIGVGLMCAAICWMLQAWLPPDWAFFGTLIVILKIGVLGFWMNSYLPGAVPAIGGALLVGALPRLKRLDSRPLDAVLPALGVVILMNSRPFEGALLSAAALVYLYPALRRRLVKSPRHLVKVVIAPAVVLIGAGLLFLGYYNWRVTGSALRAPYQVNRDTYGWPENLGFLPAKPVTLRYKALQDMYTKEVRHRDIYQSPRKLLDNLVTRAFDNWTFFFGPVLTIPLILLPKAWRNRRLRPLVIFVSLALGLNLLQMVLYPYHLGPVVPVMFAIVAWGARYLYVTLSRRNRARGLAFALVLPLCLILVGAMKQSADDLGLPLAYWERAYEPHRDARAAIEAWLESQPRPQLVIVRYSADHSPDQEWVYNHADIDGSRVVWARELDPADDARLISYFSGREVRLLEADVYPQHVVRYERAAGNCPFPWTAESVP